MDKVITAFQSEAAWLGSLELFNEENANAFTFTDRFGADTKLQFVELLLLLLQKCRSSAQSVKDQERELVAILTAIRICFREPAGIHQILESREKVEMVMDYAGLLSSHNNATMSWTVQAEASKCLVNLVAKNKPIENILVDQFEGAKKIIGLLQSQEIPHSNLFPLLRIMLHLSLTPEVAQATRTIGMNAVIHILRRCFPSISRLTSSDTTAPETTFNESDPVPVEALKVAFNLTLALGPLANGKPLTPDATDIATFHQLQPIFFHLLTTPLPPQWTSFVAIHNYIHQLKLCIVNCLLNTPKGQFQESFGAPSVTGQEPDSYMQPLNSVASARSLKALLDILAIQTQVATNETPSDALAPILMLLVTLAAEVPQVRETMKLYIFPREVLDQVPQQVAVETPTLVAERSLVASKLIPFMSSLEPALKHYVNEFFYFICDEDANEVCRLTGFGNAAGLLVMRGLMNVGNS